MPYVSRAQQGLFHSANSPVSPEKVAEWDAASKGETHLPEHVKKKRKKRNQHILNAVKG